VEQEAVSDIVNFSFPTAQDISSSSNIPELAGVAIRSIRNPRRLVFLIDINKIAFLFCYIIILQKFCQIHLKRLFFGQEYLSLSAWATWSDHAFGFHALHEVSRAVISDGKFALHIAG
jgi:hypothetical protein